jgi:flagellar biosynthesis anti-sigma factor FlgM
MEINRLEPQKLYKAFMNTNACGLDADKKNNEVKADTVEISSESANLSEARRLVSRSGIARSDARSRSEKIEALKEQIEAGEYSVSSNDVAHAILTGKHLDSRA